MQKIDDEKLQELGEISYAWDHEQYLGYEHPDVLELANSVSGLLKMIEDLKGNLMQERNRADSWQKACGDRDNEIDDLKFQLQQQKRYQR